MIYNELFIESDLPKPLDNSKVYELFCRKKEGDNRARGLIIEHNMRLVLDIVRNSCFDNIYDKKELVSVGMIGLIKAVDSFNVKSGNKFSTFANPCIFNEIRMFLKKEKKQCDKISIQAPIYSDNDDAECTLEKVLIGVVNIEDDYINLELLTRVRQLVEELPEQKRNIISKYFGFVDERLNQTQIAKIYNITPSAVSEVKIKTLKKIQDRLYKEGLIEKR